jgi:hypothetical protein
MVRYRLSCSTEREAAKLLEGCFCGGASVGSQPMSRVLGAKPVVAL